MRDNLLYERFKNLLQTNQVILQKTAADILELTEEQLFEWLVAWIKRKDTEYLIFDDLIISKNFLQEHNITYKGKTIQYDETEDTISFDVFAKLTTSLQKNKIAEIINNSVEIDKNTFIGDKFQDYFTEAMSKIEYLDSDPVESKKPLTIPKITRKNQIYWVCESCGFSNRYFLSNCKECHSDRPKSLYDKCEPVSFSKNASLAKFSISQVITDNWQTVDVIAEKMGIKNKEQLKLLKNKLTYLAKVNYVTPDTTGTRFKLNNFEM